MIVEYYFPADLQDAENKFTVSLSFSNSLLHEKARNNWFRKNQRHSVFSVLTVFVETLHQTFLLRKWTPRLKDTQLMYA